MSCTFWLRRKKLKAQQQKEEKAILEAKAVEEATENVEEATEKKTAKKGGAKK